MAVLVPGRRICMSAVEDLDRGSRRSLLRRPLVKKRGRVRLVLQRGVHACRKEAQIWFRLVAFFLSSSQIETRVSLLLLCYRARDGSWCSGRAKWWCEGEMGRQREVSVGCGSI
jgi:hypothetical protein